MRTLLSLVTGETAVIKQFTDNTIASRLMSMGVVPGVEIQLIRKTFSGATAIFQVKDMMFALREMESEKIVLN